MKSSQENKVEVFVWLSYLNAWVCTIIYISIEDTLECQSSGETAGNAIFTVKIGL